MMTMMTGRRRREEDEIQRAVFEHIEARGVRGLVAFAVPNGGWRSKTEAAIMQSLGVRRGIPDIFLFPRRGRGRGYALEIKAASGILSDDQIAMIRALEANGVTVGVTYGLDEAIAALEWWGLLRGKVQ
jgi:hypothetical protein